MTDSQRVELPFVGHDICDERHGRIDARLGSIEIKLGEACEGIAHIEGALAARARR